MRRTLLWSALLTAVVGIAAWVGGGPSPAEAQKRHKVVMFTKNVTNPF